MLPADPPRAHAARVVFISSIGGRIAFPLTGAYHAAKFGIEAVGDVFRQELRPWGISVSIVEPGSIDTPIWERGERTADEIGGRSPQRGAALRQARSPVPQGRQETAERGISRRRRSPGRSSTRSAPAAPAAAIWSASTPRSRRG